MSGPHAKLVVAKGTILARMREDPPPPRKKAKTVPLACPDRMDPNSESSQEAAQKAAHSLIKMEPEPSLNSMDEGEELAGMMDGSEDFLKCVPGI
ncbi:hypothetical protein N7539_005106 [Penicillium diatomitis]|uniref:Uncharacterized protein n=1 Tax=Penicillium diatomitis TaxID=2819901 RepID=A0A9W9X609_9EURO|nr:uncharacterized protein N7539_005106 [Penicillium diatomitis]KAJ5485118.1 hypothetical protein N7539_005106 [Penicillium diatomitis]